HDYGKPRIFKHFQVIVVVADGHDLGPGDAVVFGPTPQSMAFGAVAIKDVEDAQIAMIILGAYDGDFIKKVGLCEPQLSFLHAADATAGHCLDRIFAGQGVLKRRNVTDVAFIVLDPAGNALIELFYAFQNERVVDSAIEGQHGVSAQLLHVADQLDGRRARQEVKEKRFSLA